MHGPKPHSDLHLPGNPKGYLKYIHNWSGQNMYSRHDNFFGLLIGKTLEKRESYMFGLWGALAFIHVIGALVIYYSFMKIDVWVNKSSKDAPWTWERSHDNYYKYHTIAYDPHHRTHQHLPELEILEDQMAEAARKRGTRH
uniref:Uncharacterized protein n=1 Tax=Acrobeloides nanus TaxID=290746 RepID=A0A914DL93_9BILA